MRSTPKPPQTAGTASLVQPAGRRLSPAYRRGVTGPNPAAPTRSEPVFEYVSSPCRRGVRQLSTANGHRVRVPRTCSDVGLPLAGGCWRDRPWNAWEGCGLVRCSFHRRSDVLLLLGSAASCVARCGVTVAGRRRGSAGAVDLVASWLDGSSRGHRSEWLMAGSPGSRSADGAMADSADAVRVLKPGAAILAPVLAPAGFTFRLTVTGAALAAASPPAGSPRAGSTWSSTSGIRSGWSPTGGTVLLSPTPAICAG